MNPSDPVDELLFEVLARPESEWESALQEAGARAEPLAEELRRRFELLRNSGFVGLESLPPVEPDFPAKLGEFDLRERLGQGGMGVVYAARQERLDRTVALKLVRPEQLYFPGARERFDREISAVAKLSHPGIVSVFSVGEERGIPYFAMELLRGAGLDEVLRSLAGREPESLSGADLWAVVARRSGTPAPEFLSEPFAGPWTEVCAGIARRVAEALAHAHQSGVVHRDLKPSNVIVTPEGRIVLLDFGLARPLGVDRVTRAGSHVGSLPYMAPEQLRGEAGDARTDVYGLGVLLRELLTLRQPFLAASSETTRGRILHGEGEPVERGNRAVSWELATVCAMATELDPRRRYAAASDFARDLENVRQRRPIAARPAGALRRLWRWAERRPALATGLFVGLLAAIGTPTAVAIGIAEQRDRARAAEAQQLRKTYQANLAAANSALQAHDAAEARRRLDDCPADARGFEWHHLALALDGSLTTFVGHSQPVQAVALTQSGALLASGDSGGELRLWDVALGSSQQSFTQHHTAIVELAFNADDSLLYATDAAGHTSVTDVAARRVLAERERTSAHDLVHFGPAASGLIASLGGWRIAELDPRTLAVRREFALEQVGKPREELLIGDGHHVCGVSGSDLLVWDQANGRLLYRLSQILHGDARGVSISRDGRLYALTDSEGRIAIVDLGSGRLLQEVSDDGAFGDLAFDARGERVAEVGPDGVLRVFDVASGRSVALELGHTGPVHSVAFGGGGTLVATGGEDRSVRLWSPFGGRDQQLLRGHVGIVTRLAVTPGGDRLVSVSRDGSMRIWETKTGMPLATRPDYPHHVNALGLESDGERAWTAFHGTLLSTSIRSMSSSAGWTSGRRWIVDLVPSSDGRVLLAATSEGCLLLDTQGPKILRELLGHSGIVRSCALDREAAFAFGGGEDGRVLAWDLRKASEPRLLFASERPVGAIALAGDGRSLFVAAGATLQRVRIEDGGLEWQERTSSSAHALLQLADGARVVTGHADGSVVFWDAESGAPVLARRLGESGITALACDPQGRFVATGGEDGMCNLLRASAPLAPGEARRFATTRAAMPLHAALRTRLWTGDAVAKEIDGRTDLDPDLREGVRTCERCWPRMPWSVANAAYELVLDPGLTAERYRQMRLVGLAYLEVAGPRHSMGLATIALADVRLGDAQGALEATELLTEGEIPSAVGHEPALRAARALALCALGQRAPAEIQLVRLAEFAARPDARPEVVALWREVEAALAK